MNTHAQKNTYTPSSSGHNQMSSHIGWLQDTRWPGEDPLDSDDGNLVDNFSHESDITSLQDPFTSRPYKTPFYFYYCVPRKIRRGILFQLHVEYSPSSRLLVFALAVYANASRQVRPIFPWLWALYFPGNQPMFTRCFCFGLLFTLDDNLGHTFILQYGTFSSPDASNLLIPINRFLHVGLKPSIYNRAARL